MQLEKRKRNKRKTIDKMEFDVPLAPQRRLLTIAQKLQVLDYYDEIKAEKAVAQEALLEPSTAGGSRSSRKAFASRMKEARYKLKKIYRSFVSRNFLSWFASARFASGMPLAKMRLGESCQKLSGSG